MSAPPPPSYCPHVARRRQCIEPEGRCSPKQALECLKRLKPLLRIIGVRCNHPGFVCPNAHDSIGTLLCPATGPSSVTNVDPKAEQYRAQLVDLAGRDPDNPASMQGLPSVQLQLRTHETLFVEDAEQLEPRQRYACVAVKGSNEVARRLDREERALAELTVRFGNDGPVLSLRQQREDTKVLLVLTSAAPEKRRRTFTTSVGEAQRGCLTDAFLGAGRGRLGQVDPDPLKAWCVALPAPASPFYLLPSWMSEHLATAAQHLLRLHVLASAATAAKARMLYFDKVTVHRCDDPRYYQNKEHTLIKATWHAASASCLCRLHRRAPAPGFQRVEFRVQLCGAAFETVDGRRRCPRHCGEDAGGAVESSHFPNCCARALKVELWCCHAPNGGGDGGGGNPRASSLRMEQLTGLLDHPRHKDWMRQPFVDMVCCACALAKPDLRHDQIIELKADCDTLAAALESECQARGHTDAALGTLDESAVWLLRRGDGALHVSASGLTATVKGKKRLPDGFPDLAPTHGHLFKRAKG